MSVGYSLCTDGDSEKREMRDAMGCILALIPIGFPIVAFVLGCIAAWRTDDVMYPLFDLRWSWQTYVESAPLYRAQKATSLFAIVLWSCAVWLHAINRHRVSSLPDAPQSEGVAEGTTL